MRPPGNCTLPFVTACRVNPSSAGSSAAASRETGYSNCSAGLVACSRTPCFGQLAKGSHPGKHVTIALPGGRERTRAHHSILRIDDGRDVQILVCVDTADNGGGGYVCLDVHVLSSGSTEWLRQDQLHGQDSHVTGWSGPSRVTGNGEANPHRKAFPGGRQVRGKTHRSPALLRQARGRQVTRRPSCPADCHDAGGFPEMPAKQYGSRRNAAASKPPTSTMRMVSASGSGSCAGAA